MQHGAGTSRKDKSLGLLCDNFLQLFASGPDGAIIQLEVVAGTLGVGRRRICALPAPGAGSCLRCTAPSTPAGPAFAGARCRHSCVSALNAAGLTPACSDDIVNVLESLEVVQKGESGKYTWRGMTRLPQCVARLEAERDAPGSNPVVLLVDESAFEKVRAACAPPRQTPGAQRSRRAGVH